MDGHGLCRLVDRVRAEVGKASLHDGLVFFWSSCLAIVGYEFRKIRPGDDERYAAARVEHHLALWIGTIKIGLFAVLLKRDGNQRPRSYEVFGRRLAWLQASSMLLAAVLAIIGARIAAGSAYRRANKLHWEGSGFHRLREHVAERERINGVLHALRQELIQLWFMLAGDIAQPIEAVDPARKLLPYWPCNQSYFSIFDANAAAIGLVENEQLRTSLVRTFMLAKRLVDQYQRYNRVQDNALLLPPEGQDMSSNTTYALHAGAFAVVETYRTLKPNVEQLRNLLDAELRLPRIPLPFIDGAPASQNVSERHEDP
ncbi:MAG: hypothetical protein WB586_24800 [Chthoniobacterales bacterium]